MRDRLKHTDEIHITFIAALARCNWNCVQPKDTSTIHTATCIVRALLIFGGCCQHFASTTLFESQRCREWPPEYHSEGYHQVHICNYASTLIWGFLAENRGTRSALWKSDVRSRSFHPELQCRAPHPPTPHANQPTTQDLICR